MAFPANLVFVAVTDIADTYVREHGQSYGAFLNSLLGLTSKLGTSLAGAIIAFVLHISTYMPNVAQDERALSGIQVSFVLSTFIMYTSAAVFRAISLRYSMKTER